MRSDSQRLKFEIEARDGSARAGVLHTAHGPIETPAFIQLATKGTVRGLESGEVAGLGYQLILGNTYHLFVSPGPERIAAAGGLHGFMGWKRALIVGHSIHGGMLVSKLLGGTRIALENAVPVYLEEKEPGVFRLKPANDPILVRGKGLEPSRLVGTTTSR